MIHPSYVELMKVVNDEGEIGEEPVGDSRKKPGGKQPLLHCSCHSKACKTDHCRSKTTD